MTSEQLWHVAARVLGVYFVVEGALYLPGAIAVGGMELPEGSSRLALVVAPLLQAGIAIVAGALLLKAAARTIDPGPAMIDIQDGLAITLQVLGVLFLVEGISTAARPAVDMMFNDAGWEFRVGEFGAAVISVAAGVILTARPGLISRRLHAFRQGEER